jgi:DNA polymerase I-like protein with 3'-5' exonuclease and polymerase domains
MLEAYASGDPYLAFARQAGAAPVGATKKTHAAVRDVFKACVLAVQYGMGRDSLAVRIGQTPAHARALLQSHREIYHTFWRWSEAQLDTAMQCLYAQTCFGWTFRVDPRTNTRTLLNFPMQANGAEMLRLACCLGTERGVRICAPVHDALLIEAPMREVAHASAVMRDCMAEASRVVLGGLALRTDVKFFFYPRRYRDPRGAVMWATVHRLLAGEPMHRLAWRVGGGGTGGIGDPGGVGDPYQ